MEKFRVELIGSTSEENLIGTLTAAEKKFILLQAATAKRNGIKWNGDDLKRMARGEVFYAMGKDDIIYWFDSARRRNDCVRTFGFRICNPTEAEAKEAVPFM